METVLAAVVGVLPVLLALAAVLLRLRRLRGRGRAHPFGVDGAGVREPRRPLVPAGTASAALPEMPAGEAGAGPPAAHVNRMEAVSRVSSRFRSPRRTGRPPARA